MASALDSNSRGQENGRRGGYHHRISEPNYSSRPSRTRCSTSIPREPAVIMRALFLGTLVLAPWGGSEAIRSSPTRNSLVAVIILGVVGTGIARAMSASLGGSTGASRAALIGYIVPIVAIVLGVVFRDETVEAAEIAGTVLILCGAFLISRKQLDRRPSVPTS